MDPTLILQVVPLGIGAALTPSLLALQVLVCSADPWGKRAMAVVAGNALSFGLIGALVVLGFAAAPSHGVTIGWLIRVLAGLVLAAAAAYLLMPHPRLARRVESSIEGFVSHASTWAFFGFAFILSIKDVSSFVMLVPAIHAIVVVGDVGTQAVAAVVLYACALSTVLIPPLVRLLRDRRSRDPMRQVYRFTMEHQLQIGGTVAAVISAYLVVTGLMMLAGSLGTA